MFKHEIAENVVRTQTDDVNRLKAIAFDRGLLTKRKKYTLRAHLYPIKSFQNEYLIIR